MVFLQVIIIMVMIASSLSALPRDASVVHGNVQITENGQNMTVFSNGKSIVDWDSFSIANGEYLEILQSGIDPSILNRVTGTDISYLNGVLKSNGSVYLINPHGY